VPLGYRYIPEPHGGQWEIDDNEGPLVRRIFAMCLAGMPTRAIARQLTQDGIPTPLDRRPIERKRRRTPGVWSATTVHNVLTYEGYTGVAAWGKRQNLTRTTRQMRPRSEWLSLKIPAILDLETFQTAQQQLHRHKDLASRNRNYEYLLINRRFCCGHCGRGMTGAPRRTYRYYVCSSTKNIVDRGQRCRGAVRADTAEHAVWQAVMRVLEHPDMIAAEVARRQATAGEQREQVQQELMLLETALAKCDREEQQWAEAYAAEVISLEELKGYRAEIGVRRQSLLSQHGALQAKIETIGEMVGQVEALIGYCARVCQRLQTFDVAEKRLALEALDIRVTWIPGQPFEIHGSIPIGDLVSIPPG